MKNILNKGAYLIIILVSTLLSCEEGDILPIIEPSNTEGLGNIKIKSGTATTEITGESVWETIIDESFLFLSDQTNTNRGLIISFNVSHPPTRTTTYKIVENASEEDPNQIDIVFSEYKTVNNKISLLQWSSTDQSGELTLVVNGDKVTANLDGIVLKPRLISTGFDSLNIGEYAKPGTLYGSFYLRQ